MMKGLKYPHSYSNEKIAETYEKLAKSIGDNSDIKIGKNCFSVAMCSIYFGKVFLFSNLYPRHTSASLKTSLKSDDKNFQKE